MIKYSAMIIDMFDTINILIYRRHGNIHIGPLYNILIVK